MIRGGDNRVTADTRCVKVDIFYADTTGIGCCSINGSYIFRLTIEGY